MRFLLGSADIKLLKRRLIKACSGDQEGIARRSLKPLQMMHEAHIVEAASHNQGALLSCKSAFL